MGDDTDDADDADDVDGEDDGADDEGDDEDFDDFSSTQMGEGESGDGVFDDSYGDAQSECQSQSDDEGFQLCGFNRETNECFAVVESNGLHGKGNFDDGFVSAQQKAQQQSSSLYTAIGILGGILGALVLVIAGGGYYLYSRKQYEVERGYEHGAVALDMLPQEQEMIDVDIEVDDDGTHSFNGHRRATDSEALVETL